MSYEFSFPDVGEGITEGELVSWLVETGERVTEDQPIAEVETDKALVEIPSPVVGTVRERRVSEGDVVPVGSVFVTFDTDSEGATFAQGDTDTDTGFDIDIDTGTDTDDTDPDTSLESGQVHDEADDGPSGRIFAPPRVRQRAREVGVDIASVDGSGPSGRITEADVRAAAETAPASDSELAEPTSGLSDEVGTESSKQVPPSPSSEANRRPKSEEANRRPKPESVHVVAPTDSDSDFDADGDSSARERTLATPATRRIAAEEGVDVDAVPAVEYRDGEALVTASAVREYAAEQRTGRPVHAERPSEPDQGSVTDTDLATGTGRDHVTTTETDPETVEPTERERREPLTGVRRTVSDAMVESKFTAPHVTHHDEVDVTTLVETRETLAPIAADRGISLTYLPFIVKAVVAGLQAFPELNAVLDEAESEIVYRDYYHVGIATATEAGLLVPVVEDVDEKGLLQLASEINDRAKSARERTIAPDALSGSTFTITNVGGIGGEYATPILNYPESGILAVGEIRRKPWVVTDDTGAESIEPRSIMPLSLSFDHRLVDGAVGARFTNEVKRYLREPSRFLLE